MDTRNESSRRFAALSAVAIATVILVIPQSPASADPPNCSASVVGSTSSLGVLKATASGSCSATATRTLRVEIKQDISFQPDPLVAANSQTATARTYKVSVSSCDHGNTAKYYGRGFFTSGSDYHDTAHTTQHTC